MTLPKVAGPVDKEPEYVTPDFIARNERHHGQLELLNPEVMGKKRILVIGAGAIGSFMVTTLSKMGAKLITVMDSDTIEDHNISNQLYPELFIGVAKVDALKHVVKDYSGIDINILNTKLNAEDSIKDIGDFDIVVSAVDNMDVRKMLWNKTLEAGIPLFFDGRMGSEVIRAYAIETGNPDHVKFYAKTLYTAAQARPERCTNKSIIYTVNIVAGILNSLVKKKVNGQKCPVEICFDINRLILTDTYR